MTIEAPSPGAPAARLLIFLHIAKTAGTTFAGILERHFGRRRVLVVHPRFGIDREALRALPAARLARVACVHGHFNFGIHETIARPSTYATFVREPVAQVLSRFHHARTSPHHPLHALAGRGLDAFLRKSPQDYQTRTLLGPRNPDEPRHRALTGADLRRALDNLERHFAFVGITERFDESLLVARRALGLRRSAYVPRNVRRREPDEPGSIAARAEVEATCRLDLELYARVRERLEASLAALPDLERELRELREENRRYARFAGRLDALAERLVRGGRFARSRMRGGATVTPGARTPSSAG